MTLTIDDIEVSIAGVGRAFSGFFFVSLKWFRVTNWSPGSFRPWLQNDKNHFLVRSDREANYRTFAKFQRYKLQGHHEKYVLSLYNVYHSRNYDGQSISVLFNICAIIVIKNVTAPWKVYLKYVERKGGEGRRKNLFSIGLYGTEARSISWTIISSWLYCACIAVQKKTVRSVK